MKNRQLARQWQLLRILENARFGIDINELAQKAETCRRTIERDLKSLQEIGFPISSDLRDGGKKFWKMERKFLDSDKLVLGPTEMVSMHLARQCLSPLAGTCFGDGLNELWDKIQSLLPDKALGYFFELDETLYVKLLDVNSSDHESALLEVIRKALDQSKAIMLTYGSDDGYTIEFHPYGLVLYEGSMYLIGYSVSAQALRTYKIKRLADVEITQKSFHKPDDFSLERCVSGSFGIIYNEIKPITFRCEFSDWAARLIREQKWHRTQVIEEDSGDKLTVSFLLNATTEFKKWILGFGPAVRVIEPEGFKNEILLSLQSTLDRYT